MVRVSPTGLCSVTLRKLPTRDVAAAAGAAGLHVVEWGADVHAPVGDSRKIAAARDAAEAHGLISCSYGSYFRAGPQPGREFEEVAQAANLLGADRVRVWAGAVASGDASSDIRCGVTDALKGAADIAADHGLQLALEYHGGTLTDSPSSTLDLLDDIGCENVSTYWQPPVGMPDDDALAGLQMVLERVSAIHVFSWWPRHERHPLSSRADLWRRVFALVRSARRQVDALLEFVPDDDPAVLHREAATLGELVRADRL